MSGAKFIYSGFLFILLLSTTACPTTLKVVNVSAPKINCVFNSTCKVTVSDTTATIPLGTGGSNFLQSRTFSGKPGAPANGLRAYLYRIDLRNALGATYIPCISKLKVKFGPITNTLDYNDDSVTGDQVFVVTGGGLGSVGVSSAVKDGDYVTFTFERPVCAGGNPGSGESTYFFGLVSPNAPTAVTAEVVESISGTTLNVAARAANVDSM